MIEVTVTVRKTTPDASGPWLPEIVLAIPERETPLVLPLSEAEELLEQLGHCVDYARQLQQEQGNEEPSD